MKNRALAGKVALVTGGGGGIGKAVCSVFAREGAIIACCDVDYNRAVQVCEEVGQTYKGALYPFKVNIISRLEVEKLFQQIERRFSRLDILVTSAGIVARTPLLEITEEEWDRVLAVNLKGTFLCVKEAARLMTKQGEGKIVTVASDTAKRGGRFGSSHYAASKGGVVSFTRTVARELAAYPGISVNCVCPGPTDTSLHETISEEQKRAIVSEIPKGRFARPEEIASAILFLVSDEASFVYGETLNVNGGVVMD